MLLTWFSHLQNHMKKYVKMIIKKMKDEKLFASQGGPIILSQVWLRSKKLSLYILIGDVMSLIWFFINFMAQIENEYNHIQLAYREKGRRYVQWAANMAVKLKTGVPWVMCKQKDAPDPVVSSQNLSWANLFCLPKRHFKVLFLWKMSRIEQQEKKNQRTKSYESFWS